MNLLMWKGYLLINKFCKKFDISILVSTKVGMKALNHPLKSYKRIVLETRTLNPEDLYLGFDGLKDDFSLLDVCLNESPHYDFFRKIDSKEDIKDTDYIRRFCNGTLDFRRPVPKSTIDFERFSSEFMVRKKNILEENYIHIQVYSVNKRYYIADGKHRAALCAFLGVPIRCDVISSDFLLDSYRQWIFRKMSKSKGFIKHCELNQKLIGVKYESKQP